MIAERLTEIAERIARAERAAGRAAGSVRLVAVSKTKPASAIREAYAAGQRDFGENYAQELADKARELAALTDIRWHFIGHLQSNKAKLVVPIAHLVHTVDSARLAHELAKRAEEHRSPLEVLVELNVAAEARKHGAAVGDIEPIVEAIEAEPRLRLRGLMTIPPADLELARRAFEGLAAVRERFGAVRLPELSMGMSDDLEVAVACGATIVRVGTAIFGAREQT
jgi:pyridoxal phosphate enzyme (YggS family)